jgi:hypothetical protein
MFGSRSLPDVRSGPGFRSMFRFVISSAFDIAFRFRSGRRIPPRHRIRFRQSFRLRHRTRFRQSIRFCQGLRPVCRLVCHRRRNRLSAVVPFIRGRLFEHRPWSGSR